MKFLFKYDVIIVYVTWLAVMLKVVLDHLVGNVACAPRAVADGPKVPAPVTLAQLGVLGLNPPRTPAFQTLDQVVYRQRRTVFDMNVNMVFADNAFQDPNVLSITDLLDQFTATQLNVTFQHRIPVLGHPDYVNRKPGHRVAANTLIFTHSVNVAIWVAIENLALKAHSFN